MSTPLTLAEIKRVSPPYATEEERDAADRYWATRTPLEREEAERELLRAFNRLRGVDIDQPMPKTIRRITWEEKNQQHVEFHDAFEKFLADL